MVLVVLVVLVLIVVVIALVVEESVWRLRSAPSLADSPLMSSSAAAAASAMGLVRGQLLVVPLVLVCASTLAGNIRIFIH